MDQNPSERRKRINSGLYKINTVDVYSYDNYRRQSITRAL